MMLLRSCMRSAPLHFIKRNYTNSSLHFPDADTMRKYLNNHPLLKMDYFQEKGITKVIAELATERFANSEKEEMGVKIGAMLLIEDLKIGEDGFTGKPLPNLGKIGLRETTWAQISMATEQALIDCANNVVRE